LTAYPSLWIQTHQTLSERVLHPTYPPKSYPSRASYKAGSIGLKYGIYWSKETIEPSGGQLGYGALQGRHSILVLLTLRSNNGGFEVEKLGFHGKIIGKHGKIHGAWWKNRWNIIGNCGKTWENHRTK
jgi:hypothetical protein